MSMQFRMILGIYLLLFGLVPIALAATLPSLRNESSITFNGNDSLPQRKILGIVGGRPAGQNEYPYQVAFRWRGRNYAGCGGSIIDNYWILTAAHCFARLTGDPLGDMEIVIGAANLKDRHGMILPIHSVVYHKYWHKMKQYDIAMVHTKYNLILEYTSWKSEAIELDRDTGNTRIGQMGIITGFGDTYEGAQLPSIDMRVSQIPILQPNLCQAIFGHRFNSTLEHCAGNLNGTTDTCQGDSGGPMAVKTLNGLVLTGITSSGIGCARKSTPGLYTKVSAFINWIERVKQLRELNVNWIYYYA